jgi:hypothetical protein
VRRRPAPVALLIACAAVASAGCGAERPDVGRTDPSADAPLRTLRFPAAGMTVRIPREMSVRRRRRPALFGAVRADWFVSGFAYRRREQLPRNRRELSTALRRLESEVRRRQRSFRLVRGRTTRVAGAPAVDLVGEQVISKRRLRIRSVHVYDGRGEYVLELAAPPSRFATLDREVFRRVLRTLRITGRVR